MLAKPLILTFGDARVDNIPRFERLTNRRLDNYAGTIITNKVQVLPTLELLRGIKRPKEQPLIDPQDMIIMRRQANLE